MPEVKKPYLGGFRHTQNKKKYLHSFTQTDQRQNYHPVKCHRDVKIIFLLFKDSNL